MWISFAGILLFLISVILISLSRRKLKGFWRGLTAVIAYLCLILAAVIVFLIIISGAPSQ
jgi:hypothetical protein